jgi:hypothetical protein
MPMVQWNLAMSRMTRKGKISTMGTLGSMVIGATPIGAVGNMEVQERIRLWNLISCELRVTGRRYPLQTKLVGRFLRLMSGKPLPKELQAYLADLVENKLKPRLGRRKSPDISCRNAMIRNLYPLRLREHQDSQLDRVSGGHPSCGNVTTFERSASYFGREASG